MPKGKHGAGGRCRPYTSPNRHETGTGNKFYCLSYCSLSSSKANRFSQKDAIPEVTAELSCWRFSSNKLCSLTVELHSYLRIPRRICRQYAKEGIPCSMSSCCPLPGYDHKGLSYCNCTSVSRRRNPAVLSDLYGSDAMTYAAVAQGLRERKERPPHAIPSSLTI